MGKTVLRGRWLRWGHTKGVRLPVKDAERVAIPLGSSVRVTIEPEQTHSLADVPAIHDPVGGRLDHDKVFAEGWLKRHRR